MARDWINTFVGYIVLLLLQIFIFNRINLSIYLQIQIYVLFILLLPVRFSSLVSLLLAAFMGLSVDVCSSDTFGIHMAACAAAGYLRPHLLRRVASPADVQLDIPMPGAAPFRQYILYTSILVVVHHFVLFSLEAFDLSEVMYILLKTGISAAANILIISLFELIIQRFVR